MAEADGAGGVAPMASTGALLERDSEPLRRGLEIVNARGALGAAQYARSELAATGARPRREALNGPESLTPSERRVAELAAGGQTNRYIAQALYVTPKTVEVHLTSIFRKLGISGRAGLREALAGARQASV